MSMTRQAALKKICSCRLQGTPHLVEQGLTHCGEFEDGVPSHDKDIDFWAAASDRSAVAGLFTELGAVKLAASSREASPTHDVYLVRCTDGSLLIDVKFGDLKVGALMLMGEANLIASLDGNNRFTGEARIADLLLRRLARGKQVDAPRLEQARSAWQGMPRDARNSMINDFAKRFGAGATAGIGDLLEGREPPQSVSQSLRMQVFGSYLSSFGAFRMALSKAASAAVGRLTRRPRPFGQYQRGSLTVISGTDGTGKSTTLENVAAALREHGLRCKTFYLGRGRGNVPGVATLRNAVGRKVTKGDSDEGVYRVSVLNKGASWLYAFEYFFRTLRPRFFARVLGYAVLCDRYCYDIALIPDGSASALAFTRTLCPSPDMNVVLYAPPEVILQRKAERNVEQIENQQAVLAEIIDGAYARQYSMRINTSETDVDETFRQIVDPIFQLSHRSY